MKTYLMVVASVCAVGAVLLLIPTVQKSRVRGNSWAEQLRGMAKNAWAHIRARPAQTRKEVAQLLRQFAALLDSGRSEGQAWADLRGIWQRRAPGHPLTGLCAQVAAAEDGGSGTAEGIRRWLAAESANRDSELDRLLSRLLGVCALSEQTGAPLSDLVEQLAASVDDSAELAAAVHTATAGPKLTQLLLMLLPVGGLALGQVMGAAPVSMLFGGVFGVICLVVGGLLLGLGGLWSHWMIRGVMRHV